MNTITAILEPDADGTLHLPLPPELRHGKVKVEAKLEPAPGGDETSKQPAGTVLDAFKELRKIGGLRDVIPDAVAWQREQRKDRPLPGRG
jgi:hypothetical protein